MGKLYDADEFYGIDEHNPGFFCKYCGDHRKSMLKTEDSCPKCFDIDEKGLTKPKFDTKTGNKI